MTTLLTSQSLFMLGAAITYANAVIAAPVRWWALFLIACVALLTTLILAVALAIGCRIWARWLRQQQSLVDGAAESGALTGLSLTDRRLPDFAHYAAVDCPAYVICVLFFSFWATLIVALLLNPALAMKAA